MRSKMEHLYLLERNTNSNITSKVRWGHWNEFEGAISQSETELVT